MYTLNIGIFRFEYNFINVMTYHYKKVKKKFIFLQINIAKKILLKI